MKHCHKCDTTKPRSEFNRASRKKDGLQTVCRECTRSYWREEYYRNHARHTARALRRYWEDPDASWKKSLKRLYDMTVEQYEALAASQNNACAICKQPERLEGYRLSVDHCHKTGKVRGLLCKGCNTAIGSLQDNPDLLRSALAYLEAACQKG